MSLAPLCPLGIIPVSRDPGTDALDIEAALTQMLPLWGLVSPKVKGTVASGMSLMVPHEAYECPCPLRETALGTSDHGELAPSSAHRGKQGGSRDSPNRLC